MIKIRNKPSNCNGPPWKVYFISSKRHCFKTFTWLPFFPIGKENSAHAAFNLPLTITLYKIKENNTRITAQA